VWRHESEWLAALPRLVAECAEQWNLELEEPIETPHSLIVPAGVVVLKLNAPSHSEADTEADALARWDGNGAVRLVARDDERCALLLERCVPGTELWHAGVDEIAVIAELVPRLQVELEDGHPFTRLADEADRWAETVPRWFTEAGEPFERRLLDAALDVYRTVDRSASRLVNQSPRRERAARRARAVAPHRSEAAGRRARARGQRAPPQRDVTLSLARRARGTWVRSRARPWLGRRAQSCMGLGRPPWMARRARRGGSEDPQRTLRRATKNPAVPCT
jgi:Aminoglycoside/hydroxyurea antibiotic resistance kinase